LSKTRHIFILIYLSLLLHRAFWKQLITHQRMQCYIVVV